MAVQENVIINFEVDYSQLENAQAALDKTGKIDTKGFQAIQSAIDTTATDTKGLIKTFKEVATASTKMGKTVEDAFGAGIQDALDEAGVSMDEFSAALKKANTPAISLKKELERLRDSMAKMKAEGKDTGKEFDALRQRAGKLSDAIADANAEIKNAGSDTRGLDNVVGSISALAGGYAAVQGAAALFGDENEDLQKTLVKVNGAMALATGLQQVYTAVQKEGALAKLADSVATGAQTAATRLYTFVMGGATVATKVFRAALIATGIGAVLVLLGSLISAMSRYGDETKEAKEAQDQLRASVELMNESLDFQISRLKRLSNERIAQLEAEGKSSGIILKERLKLIDDEIELLKQKEANSRKLAASEKAGSEEQQRLYKEANDFFYQQEALKSQKKIAVFNEEKKIREKQEALDKKRRDFVVNDGTAQDILKSYFELSKQEIELTIDKNNLILNDETKTFNERLKALNDYSVAKQSLIKRQQKFDLDSEQINFNKIISDLKKRKKEEGANIQAINEQIEKETTAHNLRVEVIVGKGHAAIIKETTEYNKDLKSLKDARETLRQEEMTQIVDYDEWTLNQIKKARAAQKAGMDKLDEDDKVKADKKKAQQIKDAQESVAIAIQVANIFAQISQQKTEADRREIESERNKLNEQIKAGAISKKNAEIRTRQLDQLARQAQQRAAEREKQAAVFQAVLAIPKAFLQGLSQGGIYLAAVYAALAAAEAAIIISKPVPKFFRGKKDKYEGPGVVADMGAELVERDGRMYLYTKPTQTYLGANDKVYTAQETRNIMHNTNINTTVKQPVQQGFDYDRLGKAIPRDSITINVDKDYISEAVASGLSKNNYFTSRYQFKK